MPNPFESPKFENPIHSSEEEPENEIENQKESINQEVGENKDTKQEKAIEMTIENQERIAQKEEEVSIKSLPKEEASLFNMAKEKLKKNLRHVVLFGVMGTSLLSIGCEKKGLDRPVQENPTASVREDGKIVIERNGKEIITTNRIQRILQEGNRRAQKIVEQQAESIQLEIDRMNSMESKNYVKSKIETINHQIEMLKKTTDERWKDDINGLERRKAELIRIIQDSQSEDYAKTQRQGFERFLRHIEKLQEEKDIEKQKDIEKRESKNENNDDVIEGPDFSRFDPTLKKN